MKGVENEEKNNINSDGIEFWNSRSAYYNTYSI